MRQKGGLDLGIGGVDWLIAVCTGLLIFIGWSMIFASEYNAESHESLFDLKKSYGKQLLWAMVAAGLAVTIQLIESKFYRTFAIVFYFGALLLLIAVLFTKPVHGATSWFSIAGFRFQPSEFAKVATCLALATFLSGPEVRLTELNAKIQAIGIILLPTSLVLLQGDAGSTMVYAAFFIVLFRAGLDMWMYIMGVVVTALSIASLVVDSTWGLILLLVIIGNLALLRSWRKDDRLVLVYLLFCLPTYFFFEGEVALYILGIQALLFLVLAALNIPKNWQISLTSGVAVFGASLYVSSVHYFVNHLLKPHQQERIWVWLRPEKCDPLGPLYNLEQSKFAIGSGGWSGKGFLEGERTKLDYVPEQSTDFIFCTVGEEWGFFGTIILLGIFLILIFRILFIAEQQRSSFSRYYAYGVAGILFFHVFVNIGMTTGLVPVIGIPLPFISYGGSSLISFSILIAVLVRLDSNKLMVFR